jgi:hypothetical protein
LALLQRSKVEAQFGKWRALTVIAALRCDGIGAPYVFDRPIAGQPFKTHAAQILTPTPKADDDVIMDNFGIHKSKALRDTIKAA